MQCDRVTLEDCAAVAGTVVVIDVIRAFSTAAYAFASGAREIIPVSGVEEALTLKKSIPGSLVMGEIHGLPPAGFDYGNSPTEIVNADLQGRTIIQRTGAGTQGIVRSVNAETILAASFCCATATANYLRQLKPDLVTFVITGVYTEDSGDEDAAFADYLESLLLDKLADLQPLYDRVRNSPAGLMMADPAKPEFPGSDLDYCLHVDRFNFAMRVERHNGYRRLKAFQSPRH